MTESDVMSTSEIALLVALLFINYPVYRWLFRRIFGSVENYREAARDADQGSLKPFWFWTASRAEVQNQEAARFFLLLSVVGCGAVVAAEYLLITRLAVQLQFMWKVIHS